MSHPDFEELAALAALDILDASEQTRLDAHLAGCAPCREALAGFAVAAGALAYAAPPARPREALKARVLASLNTEPTAAPIPSARPATVVRPPVWWRGLVAAAAVLVVAQVGTLAALTHARAELAALQSQVADARGAAQALQAQNVSLAEKMEMVLARDVRVVSMTGMDGQPTARTAKARVFWSPAKHAWLVTFYDLPRAHEGKTYQLWAVTPDAKMSMGTFEPNAQGEATVIAHTPGGGKPMATAVSVEPMGGMPHPTGPIVMLGAIKDL